MKGPASRRRLLTFALLGLCLSLAVLAFVPPPPGPAPERTRRVTVAALETDGGARAPAKARAGNGPAFQRPIFVPTRRLAADGGHTGADMTPIGGLKLKAVFLGPDVEKAFLATSRTPQGQWVNAGQSFEGWRVELIKPESVVLAGRGGRHEIELEKPEAAPARRRQHFSPRKRTPAAQPRRGAQASPAEESAPNGQEPD